MPTYQVMPPLSTDDYEALKADIAANGVRVSVEFDENNNILDGHNRVAIYKELQSEGVALPPLPRVVKIGMSEEQKTEYALVVNSVRRQLSKEWKKQKAIDLRKAGWTQERIGRILGVPQQTLSRWLIEFTKMGKLPEESSIIGADGKQYPATRQRKEIELDKKDNTPCEQCKSAHPWCDDCCSTCDDKCNIHQSCRLQPSTPITPYNPIKTQTGKPAPAEQPEPGPQDTHEIIRQNTDRAFSTIYDRVIYLSADYANIAQCLLENPNRTREDTAQKLSECIERLQQIKIAVLKTSTLRAVK